WVAILPFLGFYENWRKILFGITGIFIIYLAYLFYSEAKVRVSKEENKIKSFIDNIGNGEDNA
ncbi:MAG: hypothetical protein WCW65_01985, partial [Candidatus Paceibacterota bacterium]